jgi:hypothetical protein
MVTGQDADWHYTNFPGPAAFDNPQGFLLDSINWAGSGTGLGLVLLGQEGTGGDGASNFGLTGYSSDEFSQDSVLIPAAEAGFPINTGLTSAGLSNWSSSSHRDFFNVDATMWNGINLDGSFPAGDHFVTIVSASTAGGGIGGTVPEPSSIMLFGSAMLLVGGGLRRRMKRS